MTRLLLCSCLSTRIADGYFLPGVFAAIPGLLAVAWLAIRLQPVQKPLFRCELASVNCHCGDGSDFSVVRVIFFLGGIPVGALVVLGWQWCFPTRAPHSYQRLPSALTGAIGVG